VSAVLTSLIRIVLDLAMTFFRSRRGATQTALLWTGRY
jgi:hypothetical protein